MKICAKNLYRNLKKSCPQRSVYNENCKLSFKPFFSLHFSFYLYFSRFIIHQFFFFFGATLKLLFLMTHLLWIKFASLKKAASTEVEAIFWQTLHSNFFLSTVVLPKDPLHFIPLNPVSLKLMFSLSSLWCLGKESHSICF